MTTDPIPDKADGTMNETSPEANDAVPRSMTSRPRAYGSLIGVVTVLLSLGLILPVVVGERARLDQLTTDLDPLNIDLDIDAADRGVSTTVLATESTDDVADDAPEPDTATVPTAPAGPSDTPDEAPADVVLTASDVGVSPTEIKVGVLVPTADGIGSTGDQQAVQVSQFQAYIDDINDRGGIHGRTLTMAVATYDILDQNAGARSGCLRLADDQKVFAVFNTTGYAPPGALCLTREKGVPFLQSSGHPEEVYSQANGLYSSTFDNQTRNFRNLVANLDDLGILRGKKIGVLGTSWLGLRRQQEDGIVRSLQNRGYNPSVYWLGSDPITSQAQVPLALLQMRQAGVQVMIMGADFLSAQSFVNLATAQGYRPRYAAADSWGYPTDAVSSSMGAGFEGAITVTAMRLYDHRVDVPEPAVDAECARVVNKYTNLSVNRANDPHAVYMSSMMACGVVRRFEAAALAAGPNLTRAGLVQAVANAGTVEIPFAGGPATYRPDKLDGADFYRAQQWSQRCRCWRPLTPGFKPGE